MMHPPEHMEGQQGDVSLLMPEAQLASDIAGTGKDSEDSSRGDSNERIAQPGAEGAILYQ